nr:ISL3 family transposase [Ligilactobacillus salitolerans]
MQTYSRLCPKCRQTMRKNGFKTVQIVGLRAAGILNIFLIRKQKFICPASKKCKRIVTKIAKTLDVEPNTQIAKAVKYHSITQLKNNRTQADIAEEYGISTMSVMRFGQEMASYFKPRYTWLPQDIAFDDFKSSKFAKSGMSILLMDIAQHRTLDIIRSRTNTYLRNYFYQYPRKARLAVQTVTVDLYSPYRPLIKEPFPNALIIADRFHTVVQAYRGLNSVRISVMKQYGAKSHEGRALKRFWKLLVKDSNKVDYQEHKTRINFQRRPLTDSEVVDRLLKMSPELAQAYKYYQDLLLAVNRKDAVLLEELLNSPQKLPEVMKKVNKTLLKHFDEIVNSFKTSYSNGPVEGTNNKIKVIKKTAYGFRNFANFRLRILLALKTSFLSMNIRREIKKATRPIQEQAA